MKTTKKKTSKQKKNQQILIGVIIVVILIVLYLKFRKPKEDKAQSLTSGGTSTSSSSSSSSSSSTSTKLGNDALLKYGTRSAEVKWVQTLYNSNYAVPLGRTKLTVDGIFGTKTQAAVKFVLGKTTTTWTEFKRFVDNGPAPANNSFQYNPFTPESTWAWSSQP